MQGISRRNDMGFTFSETVKEISNAIVDDSSCSKKLLRTSYGGR